MSLAKKLQLKDTKVRVVNKPRGLDLDDVPTSPKGEAVLVFVTTAADLKQHGDALFKVARNDGLAWVAYPKAGKLGTDLNRDSLWKATQPSGTRPVRQISIDATWSALRYRPA